MSVFSKNTCRFFCVLAIFCFYQMTHAQSGRRVQKNSSTEQKSTTEAASATTETNAPADEIPVRISSLTVIGEVQHDFAYYSSNTIDIALKELVRTLKSYTKSLSEITRGDGKTNYAEAKELAKESEAFVLWLGFSAKNDSYGKMYIDSIQYAVLIPKTAKVLTRGEIEPKQNSVLTTGGVLNLPKSRRRSSATALLEMKEGARQIAAILVRGGWLK